MILGAEDGALEPMLFRPHEFLQNVADAKAGLRNLFPATPLQRNDHLSVKHGADVYLKREDLTPVRSYKLRGAFNAMRSMPGDGLVVAASAGNHAQGVAFICRELKRRGVIFMPVTTPQQKVQKTQMFGEDFVEVRLVGDYFDVCLAEAQAFCMAEKGVFLSPFDNHDIITGQATVTAEIFDEIRPEVIVMPVGGGGLGAGARAYLDAVESSAELLLIEPEGGASLAAALRAGALIRLNEINTFVDGAAVAQIGKRNFEILQHETQENVYSAPEDRICGTILELLNIEGIVLEPAGALSIDLLPHISDRIKGKTVVCVTSGGNFDFERLPEVKERSQRYKGLKKYFVLTMPQRPGALKDFLGLLGPNDDISRFEYLKKSARNFGSVLIGIETNDPANFQPILAGMDAEGFSYLDITNDEALSGLLI